MNYQTWLIAWQRVLKDERDSVGPFHSRFEKLHRVVWPGEHLPGYRRSHNAAQRTFPAEISEIQYHGKLIE